MAMIDGPPGFSESARTLHRGAWSLEMTPRRTQLTPLTERVVTAVNAALEADPFDEDRGATGRERILFVRASNLLPRAQRVRQHKGADFGGPI